MSLRDIVRFVIGLVVFLGIGRLFKKQPQRLEMRRSVDQPGQEQSVDQQHHTEHEFRDASPRGIALVGLSVVVALIATYLLVWGMFSFFSARQAQADRAPPLLAATPQALEGPRLQVNSEQERVQALAPEREQLSTYAWIDQNNGIVRIPIERAIELMSEPGRIPARADGTAPLTYENGYELESEGGQPATQATAEPGR